MAIVKMNKISVIGLESEKKVLLKSLMDLGIVELNDQSEKLLSKDWTAITRKDGEEEYVSKLDARIASLQTVLQMIARYDKGKKSLFSVRKTMTADAYEKVLGDVGKAEEKRKELESLCEQWNALKTQQNTLTAKRAALLPWSSYELKVEDEGTQHVAVLCGVIPAIADYAELKEKLETISEAVEITQISKDQEQQYISMIYMRSDEEAIMDALKSSGFVTTIFKDMTGTVSENLSQLNQKEEELKQQERKLEEAFAKAAEDKEQIQYYYDKLIMERDRAKASEQLLRTEKTFYFDGWVIAKKQKEVEQLLEEKGCWYEIKEPEKEEETPVLLENNDIITPFETITDLYSLPSSKEVDPTPIFSLFYFIFFGMMFADMGYGIILAAVCFAVLKMFPLEGLAKKLIKMLAYCGVSTFVWGALFGGFFGNIITVITGKFFGHEIVLKPLWFDPLNDPMKMLIFSCILGAVHLFLGMGVKAYLLIKDGKLIDAVEQVFVWYAFLLGVALLLFGGSLFEAAPQIGKWLAIIGAAGIVGIPAVRGKGVGRAIGLWNLYGCTGYLGDVLSYSRLLALGLASAVIAQVFNALGSMFGDGILAAILFVVVAVIGHVFNFAINALGTFVHASRLQYVEFFGKFYEGGGVPFKPFKKNTKYVNIVKEEK